MILWALEEYFSMPILFIRMLLANQRYMSEIPMEKIYFGKEGSQYLLFFQGEKSIEKKQAIFFIHGGGWVFGRPSIYRFIGDFFARRGYPTILVGHRSSLFYTFPEQMEDIEKALNKSLQQMEKLGYHKKQLMLAGHSSGGHLAALMALKLEKQAGKTMGGLITLGAPLNLHGKQNWILKELLRLYIRRAREWHRANPIEYIHGKEKIPILCIHGRKDTIIDIENSIQFLQKYNASERKLGELIIAEKLHHSDMIKLFLDFPVETEQMLNWIDSRE